MLWNKTDKDYIVLRKIRTSNVSLSVLRGGFVNSHIIDNFIYSMELKSVVYIYLFFSAFAFTLVWLGSIQIWCVHILKKSILPDSAVYQQLLFIYIIFVLIHHP